MVAIASGTVQVGAASASEDQPWTCLQCYRHQDSAVLFMTGSMALKENRAAIVDLLAYQDSTAVVSTPPATSETAGR